LLTEIANTKITKITKNTHTEIATVVEH